jgi:hypothetical protein
MNTGHASSIADVYAPKPSDFPSPPRRIRLRAFPTLTVAFAVSFIGVGLGLFVFSVVPILAACAATFIGATAPGTIVAHEKTGRKATIHRIQFTFPVDGETHHTHIDVDAPSFDSVRVGDPVTVRFLRLWPNVSASIEEPPLARSWNDWCALIIVLFWNGATIIAFAGLVRFGARLRRLAISGTALHARIADKRVSPSRTNTYIVIYRFRTSDGVDHEASRQVSKADFDALAIGQVVTVLYDRDNPDSSIIYRCGEYQVFGFDNKVL